MFNNSSNLYDREWLALVFANRNQNYGAYQLRRKSADTLLKALFITAPLFIGVFVGPSVVAALKGDEVVVEKPTERVVEIDNIIHELKPKVEEPKPAEAKPLEQAAPKTIAPKAKTVGMTDNIKVVSDDLVKTQPPTSDELKDAVIASTTEAGVLSKGGNANLGSETGGESGLGTGTGTKGNGDEILSFAENSPEFPGGMDAWAKYIQKNLRYPSMAQEEGIGGKVFVSFVVEKDGTITDVKVTRGIGYGCDEEAMRVIKKSPRWKAGMQNNLPVRVRYNMPISYVMQN